MRENLPVRYEDIFLLSLSFFFEGCGYFPSLTDVDADLLGS